jgi:hypothetical protein
VRKLIAALAVLVALMATAGSGADTGNVNWSGNGNQTVPAVDSSGATATFNVTATDPTTSDPLPVICSPTSGSLFQLGDTPVECSTTDSGGQPATTDFTITVKDVSAPVVTPPADVTTTTTSPAGKSVSYPSATATDNVDGSLAASCLPASGSTFPVGQTAVTCSATDTAGNTGTAGFTVTVNLVDTDPPVVTVPADIAASTTDPSGKAVTFSATATDNVDGPLTPTCAPPSGSTFPVGQTTVSCHATDAHGNTGTASFKVTITFVDTVPPVVTAPSPISVSATGAATTVSFSATASDNVDGSLPVSCAPPSGFGFPVGQTTVTCSATDQSGNTGHASFTVAVQDVTPPQLTVPGNQSVGATSPAGAVVVYSAQATDNVDGTITPSCAPASGSIFPAKQTTQVTCSATDAAHNSSSKSFNVTVNDSAPLLTHVSDIVAEANGPSGAAVTYVPPSATDIVDGGLAVTCAPISGAMFPLGATTVNCSATNSSNQTSTTSFGVLVRDTTPPVMPVPGKVSLTSDAPVPVTNSIVAKFLNLRATDLVDRFPRVVSNAPPVFQFGKTTVTFTASDASGNTSTASGTVEVIRAQTPTPVVTPGTSQPERTPPGNVRNLTISVSGRSALLRWRPPTGDFDHVAIFRSAGGKKAVSVYHGKASQFVDHRLVFGIVYRYLVVAVDHVGNQSTGVAALARATAQPLFGPVAGQRVTSPVVLRWRPTRGATFYNVQLFRGKVKILSAWPKTAKLVVSARWSYSGKTQQLLPGKYTWFVWPARGTRKAPKYQALEGFNSFLVVNT